MLAAVCEDCMGKQHTHKKICFPVTVQWASEGGRRQGNWGNWDNRTTATYLFQNSHLFLYILPSDQKGVRRPLQ